MVQIRLIEEKDIEEVLDIYRPYVEHSVITFEYEVPSFQTFQKRIQQISSQFPWLILKQADELCGYAYASLFRERSAYQWGCEISVYVAKDKQGRGYGRMLYQALLAFLQAQGYIQAYAVITLPNDASMALHDRFSFQKEGILHAAGYKQNTWLDVAILRKQLNPLPMEATPPIPMPHVPLATYKKIIANALQCERKDVIC